MGVFGLVRALLELALEREVVPTSSSAATATPAADRYEQLLQTLAAAAASTQVRTYA